MNKNIIKQKFVINLHGPLCSGKTTVAKILHEKLPRTFLISGDRLKWLISDYKASLDREVVALMVFDVTKRALEAEFSIIKDSNYMLWTNSDLPKEYNKLLKDTNTKLVQYNLDAPLNILLKRLNERIEKSNIDGTKISVKDEKTYMTYYNTYNNMKKNFTTFDTSTNTADEIANKILLDLQHA